MFLGEFEHALDVKGRLILPAKFRADLMDGIVVTRGLDGCLFIFSRANFEQLAQRAAGIPLTHTQGRDFTRMLFSGAMDDVPDRQGRILLPQTLREFAGLENDVVMVGVNTHIEVWNVTAWKNRRENFKDGALNAEQWAQLGI